MAPVPVRRLCHGGRPEVGRSCPSMSHRVRSDVGRHRQIFEKLHIIPMLGTTSAGRWRGQWACYDGDVLMRTWTLIPVVVLVAVALIAVTGACLVHPEDGVPDHCASLVAVTVGLALTCSLGPTRQILFAGPDGYRPSSFDPPVPPPKV